MLRSSTGLCQTRTIPLWTDLSNGQQWASVMHARGSLTGKAETIGIVVGQGLDS